MNYFSTLSVANLTVLVRNRQRKIEILNKVNFSLRQNEFLFLIGKNGSGKTTLCMALASLLDKTQFEITGEVVIDGINLIQSDEKTLEKIRKEKIGYILQNPFASFDPILKIITQFREISDIKNIPLEKFFHLMEIFELDLSCLEKYPYELSGGMLQRLSFVRTLAHDYKILIADEPTSALDKPTSNIIMNCLENYINEKSCSIILVTQDILLAKKYASKIGLISSGKLEIYDSWDVMFHNSSNMEINPLLQSLKELTN